MGVFNNLVMYQQDVPQASLQSIVPDLATSWSWNEEGTELTFPLRQGVKWHDGKPFTAKDVKCTWEEVIVKSDPDYALSSAIRLWYKTGIYGFFCGFERWRATRCNFKRGSARPSLRFFMEQRFSAGRR